MWYKHVLTSPMLGARLLPYMMGLMFALGKCVQGEGIGAGYSSNKQDTRKLERYFSVKSITFSLDSLNSYYIMLLISMQCKHVLKSPMPHPRLHGFLRCP